MIWFDEYFGLVGLSASVLADLLHALICIGRLETANDMWSLAIVIFVVLEFLIRTESELPESRYVDFRLLVYYTEKHLYDYKSQRFNKYNLQSSLVFECEEESRWCI